MDRLTTKGYHPVHIHAEGCTGCALCAVICPDAAITVFREPPVRRSRAKAKEVEHVA
jgi:2-oxoglutarate ferredoxin oxidoreductase subunit delta